MKIVAAILVQEYYSILKPYKILKDQKLNIYVKRILKKKLF